MFMEEDLLSPNRATLPMHETVDIQLSLGPTPSTESKATYTTPLVATRAVEREDWEMEMEMETALQKVRLQRMSNATKQQQLEQMVQSLLLSNKAHQLRAKELEENQQIMEIQVIELQAQLNKAEEEKHLLRVALRLAKQTNKAMNEIWERVMGNAFSIPEINQEATVARAEGPPDHHDLNIEPKGEVARDIQQPSSRPSLPKPNKPADLTEQAWAALTQDEQQSLVDLLQAGYTTQEAAESVRVIRDHSEEAEQEKDRPEDAAQPGDDTAASKIFEQNIRLHHARIEQNEAEIFMAITSQYKKSGDIDSLFTKYQPHVPLLFMKAQHEIRKESLKVNYPSKETGGHKPITGRNLQTSRF
ncbi:hypothetical protein L7F22_055591 [Adiantum nelumboides]|nr:hypothetical protein [Adiantum nelumboides]